MRSDLLRLALVALAASSFHATAVAQSQARVVVIGVDGLDFALTSRWIAEGRLPALADLAASGGLIPLRPTNPAQSPVSWATLTTGRNPGRTGVFDFLRRGFKGNDVTAELALVEPRHLFPRRIAWWVVGALAAAGAGMAVRMWRRRGARSGLLMACATVMSVGAAAGAVVASIPDDMIVPINARGGEAIWERLDRDGVGSASLLAPMAFPAPELKHGRILCGLGVPDMMGTPGTVTVYREEPVPPERRITPTGCRVLPIAVRPDGTLGDISVQGPISPFTKTRISVNVTARASREERRVTVGVGQALEEVAESRWTPFMPVTFGVAPGTSLHGLTRFRLLEGGARTVLYQEPTCFDPVEQSPFAPITAPLDFGSDLCADGPFDTLGWACATNPLQDEVIDEATFLSDVEELDARREQMVARTLARTDWRCFFCVLSTPDRAQHLFWRDLDPAHPRHDPAAVARRGNPILDAYVRLDRLVGRVRKEFLRGGDILFVVSDHGFAPFRVSVNLNRWLAEEGLLVGTADGETRTVERSIGGTSLFPGVDWTKTKAYSMGLGKIYVNLAGREPNGAVQPTERGALVEEIRKRLLGLRHEGQPVVRSVKPREEIYSGDRVNESADLVLGFESGFRVSWQCTLGAMDEPVFQPNRSLWSGDHCSVDPDVVPGVLFSSLPPSQSVADVADIHPTVEALLGLAATPGLDGKPIQFKK